jgi:surface antigen
MYDKDKYKYINKICRAYSRTYTIKTDQTNTITAL